MFIYPSFSPALIDGRKRLNAEQLHRSPASSLLTRGFLSIDLSHFRDERKPVAVATAHLTVTITQERPPLRKPQTAQ